MPRVCREFRVYGPPGTGKTRWLARQVDLALDRYAPEDIYCVSFTKAAAVEVAGRVRLPKSNVGTIHSLCYRYLGNPPIIETMTDLLEEWNAAYGNLWHVSGNQVGILDEPPDKNTDERALANWNRDRGLMNGQCTDPEFRDRWEDFKRQTGSADFTDLLLGAPESIPAKVLLVDEVQDLTPLQWRIVRRWGEEAEVFCVVGDDDQTIYEWLGARPDEFLSDHPAAQTLVLSQSYRLPRQIQVGCLGRRSDSLYTVPIFGHRCILPDGKEVAA